MELNLGNIKSVKVVQTEEWYFEVCDKCCGFIGHLEDNPDIEVEVIVGWKEPKIWKPIYKDVKNSPVGTIWDVANDSSSFYGFDVKNYDDNLSITLNTDTVNLVGFKELEIDENIVESKEYIR